MMLSNQLEIMKKIIVLSPVDIIELEKQYDLTELILEKGKYRIRMTNRRYKEKEIYEIEVK